MQNQPLWIFWSLMDTFWSPKVHSDRVERPFNLSGFSDRFDRVERVLAVTFDRNKHVQNQFHLSNLML